MLMKNYKFKLSKTAVILSVLAILLSLGGCGWTIYRIIALGFPTFTVGLQHIVMLIVCALLLLVFISLLIKSFYRITEKEIILRFGIIKSVYKIEDIISVHLFSKTNKLVVYFKNETYTVIVVKPEWYNEFIKTLTSANKEIRYEVSYAEEDETDPPADSK